MDSDFLKAGERIDDLQRNGFRIIQRPGTFLFGTDSVLLTDFCNVKNNDSVIDMGCGAGAISLLLIARNATISVHGIEIEPDMADIAIRNAKLNGIDNKFTVQNIDMRLTNEIRNAGKYSLAVCNPPYFKEGGAIPNRDEIKRAARHEDGLTPYDIASSAARLLKYGGRFSAVYPAQRMFELSGAMIQAGIEPKRVRTVHSTIDKPPKLILIEGVKGGGKGVVWTNPLIMYNRDLSRTEEFIRIYEEDT